MPVLRSSELMSKINFEKVKETINLAWLNLVVMKRDLVEFCKVATKYYSNVEFAKVDFWLIATYLFDNPFAISKQFHQKRGDEDIYVYGETPLTTMDLIAKKTGIQRSDVVYELGSGRGRNCFWLSFFVGCRVVGIEFIHEFIERTERVQQRFHVPNVVFIQEDMLEAEYEEASVVYLYGSHLDDEFIKKLCRKLSALKSGAKVITVSYSLTDYAPEGMFEVMSCFPAQFTWGEGNVYLQIKK